MNSLSRRVLLGIIGTSILLRMLVVLVMGNQVVELPGIFDQISYHLLAQRVLDGHGFSFGQGWWPATAAGAPTAHWSFLYTFYLVTIYALAGPNPIVARAIQAVIVGILQPYLTYLITSRVFSRYTASAPWIGVCAAALNALYTYFIYYSAALMTEPFFITAVLASLYLAILIAEKLAEQAKTHQSLKTAYWLAIGLGFTLSAAVLLRQLFLVLVPFILVWIWWNNRKQVLINLIPVVMLVIFILPFTLYNYSRFHRFVLLNTNIGYVMFWANHPIYGTHFVPILPKDQYLNLIPEELRSLDEAALDQALLRLGIRFIVEDPKRYLLLSLSRVPVYFEFWPNLQDNLFSNIARVFGFGLYLPLMLYGIYKTTTGFFPRTKTFNQIQASPLTILFLFGAFYTAIHVFAWSLIRYRLPVDAVLIPFGGLAVYKLFGWLRISKLIHRTKAIREGGAEKLPIREETSQS